METITIKHIAKALNLSPSTVSRAMRDSYEIGEITKKRVLEYAKKHNYTPNPIALSLKENKSHSIGILVPEIDNPFFSQAINGIETEAYKRGYHVLIFQSYESLEREKINLNHMISRRVDGILISPSAESDDVSHLNEIKHRGMPLVFFDRTSDKIESHKIVADNFLGAFNATELLIKKGRKHIAYIGASSFLSISKERLEGYKASLCKNNLIIDNTLIRESNYTQENIEFEIRSLMAMDTPPDAILSVSERQGVLCYTAFKKLGIKIPDDLAFIGFSNLRSASLFSPSFSTITQPAFDMGQKATELLLNYIECKPQQKLNHKFETITMATEVIERDSSG